MRDIVTGILAHVDAGKTTLCEALLYTAGSIKERGSVDDSSAHLDTHAIERRRGITVFSAQAALEYGGARVTLVDTPGHVDFSAEMERSLAVIDEAVLVISGTDGVQAHTHTVWRLLKAHNIPVFIFVTKTDMPAFNKAAVLNGLRQLDAACVDMSEADRSEDIALCGEDAMREYLETGALAEGTIAALIAARKLFPCYFGSGTRLTGVEEFLRELTLFSAEKRYADAFSARVFKIARDDAGARLTFLRLTGGSLAVRAPVAYSDRNGDAHTEKITQLRQYSGDRFTAADEAQAGAMICALGLSATFAGECIGEGDVAAPSAFEPVLNYRVVLPRGCDAATFLPKLKQLEEEDPQLGVAWEEKTAELHIRLMGEVQAEVIKSLISSRFGVDIELADGEIIYKETIADTVEGVGHFEPLRHYAEVHLILEPAARGEGVLIRSACSVDELGTNWQRLILTHLAEKRHLGVLTGSQLTDVCITLAAGRAHIKHTEGGDFRQATYRAVRQGLMQAKSLLLEPYYAFRLELPREHSGRALSDIRRLCGTANAPQEQSGSVVITGRAPVSTLRGYALEVAAYTRGLGRLSCVADGYEECHNTEEVIAATGYEPERDLENTPDSVFCSHGAGFAVKWSEVFEYMQLERVLKPPAAEKRPPAAVSDSELEAIMLKSFGPIKRPLYTAPLREPPRADDPELLTCKDMIIDGYNVIFAWDELAALAKTDLGAARSALTDIVRNYQGFRKYDVTIVFDAYMTEHQTANVIKQGDVTVIYTAKNESADICIARLVEQITEPYTACVVTSDNLVRLHALSRRTIMRSSAQFIRDIGITEERIRGIITKRRSSGSETLAERLRPQSRQPKP